VPVGSPPRRYGFVVEEAAQRVAVGGQQELMGTGLDARARRPPRRVDGEVDDLSVRRGVVRGDLAEVPPSHRAWRAAEILGSNRIPVAVEHGVPAGGHLAIVVAPRGLV
jgi:hypothetical protein